MAQSQANPSREAVRNVVPDLINYSEEPLFAVIDQVGDDVAHRFARRICLRLGHGFLRLGWDRRVSHPSTAAPCGNPPLRRVVPSFSLQRSSLFRPPGSTWGRVNVSMMAGLKSPTMTRQDRQMTNAIKIKPSPNEIRPPTLGIGPKPQNDRIAKSKATAVHDI